VWTLNGLNVGAGSGLVVNSQGQTSALGADWTATGFDDFNGDGKGDALWSRTSTGEAVIVQLDGTTISAAALLGGAIGANWTVKGTGDFDADGNADLLWVRDNGNGSSSMAIWNMSGFTIKSAAVNFGLTPNPINGLVGSNMTVAGVGDLNNDGRDDIVWRDASTGANSLWLVNGPTSVTPVALQSQSASYTLKGVADFNGDGAEDLLWHHTGTNAVEVWVMNGSSVTRTLNLASIGSDWRLAGIADGTGDGISDVYWTKGGQVAIWEVGAAQEDVLTGGTGRDTFHFEDRYDTGNRVTDFQAGAGGDVLGMQAVMATLGMTGTNGLTAGVVRAFQNGSATEIQVDVRPGAGTHWVSLATLANTTATALTSDNWSF
jgi:hypothetical protein